MLTRKKCMWTSLCKVCDEMDAVRTPVPDTRNVSSQCPPQVAGRKDLSLSMGTATTTTPPPSANARHRDLV